MRRILPPLAGQFASLIKDSSLLSIIAVNEFNMTLEEALDEDSNQLVLVNAHTRPVGTEVEKLRDTEITQPTLVLDKEGNLRGIIASFDLL